NRFAWPMRKEGTSDLGSFNSASDLCSDEKAFTMPNQPTLARFAAGCATLCLVATLIGQRPAEPLPADLVLLNGRILTVDPKDSVAQAIAIGNGRILAVGATSDIRLRVPKTARVMDLHGRTVTPGLIDTHGHFTETNVLYQLNFSDAK